MKLSLLRIAFLSFGLVGGVPIFANAQTAAAATESDNAPIAAIVSISDLTRIYDGKPQVPVVTTVPADLAVELTFDGDNVPPSNAGTYHVVATVVDPVFAGSASATFTVKKAVPTITWPQPAAITYGTALTTAQLDATANVAGTFTYTPGFGTILNAGPQQILSADFAPTDTVNYTSVSSITTIVVNKAVALVTLSDLSQPYDSTPATVTTKTIPANLRVDVAYDSHSDAPVFPGHYGVAARVVDPNYAGTAYDTLSLTITALVRHAPRLRGGIDGSLQVLSGEDVVLSGNGWISGDLLVPGTPALDLDGLPTAVGVYDAGGEQEPTDYSVELGGASVVRYLVRQIDPMIMPAIAMPQESLGTQDVTVSAPNTTIDFASLRNLTLAENAGEVVVPPGVYRMISANAGSTLVLGHSNTGDAEVYQLQGLALFGGARLRVAGPVLLVLANGASIGGVAGDAHHPEWLTLAVAAGGVSLKSDASLSGYVDAPAGEVVIGRGAVMSGEVISDRLTINADGLLSEPRREAQ